MNLSFWSKCLLVFHTLVLMCCSSFANENLFRQARTLQREGKYDEAIVAFRNYLSQPAEKDSLTKEQLTMHTDALVQLMNTFQSKGEPEVCITTLQDVFRTSPALQKQCLRDFYSVMGYALSRTENMKEAEETMIKVFTLPLYHPTPERYFRDYAYAAAVFYSNPDYQKEVIYWCQEALVQAQLCKNTSGKQWVTAMLGSIYKRNGNLNEAVELFQQSKEEAQERKDDLGVLNSLNTLIDIFLYWDIPEYANQYASEAILVEKSMSVKNPMVSAQTYIKKGWALLQSGETDSVPFYAGEARKLCRQLPYNSGMVDVNLLYGTYLTENETDTIEDGISELQQVAMQGTAVNRAKAYHQLTLAYLKCGNSAMAETMSDSLYSLLAEHESPIYIQLEYQPVLEHFLKTKNKEKVEQYVGLMLRERQIFKKKRVNFNLVETIVDLQTEQKRQELKVVQLEKANQRLWLIICIALSVIIVSVIATLLFYQRKQHTIQMKQADKKLSSLIEQLNRSNAEKEMRAEALKEFLKEKSNRQELETLTPSVLQTDGESKFRQCFELLYPLFLPQMREKVPSITQREELLSMLIVLKQDNKRIAELLAIAPRSVLMLRHRFRQKIGMNTEYSLENFIEDILEQQNIQEKSTDDYSA